MAGKKTGKRLLTWVLVLVMALSLLPLNALAADGPETDGGSGMDFKKVLLPNQPDGDGNYTIRMTAQATGKEVETTKPVPMDIVLVLDQSGSMAYNFEGKSTSNNKARRQYAMKEAVISFIDEVADKNADHRMAIVTFSDDAETLAGWTPVDKDGKATLISKISGLTDTPSGATNVGAGMTETQSLMRSAPTGENRQKTVIVFTDGVPTTQSNFDTDVANNAISAAKDMKAADVTIYTVGIFNGANPDQLYGDKWDYALLYKDVHCNGEPGSYWGGSWAADLFGGNDFEPIDVPAGNRFLNYLSSNFKNATQIGVERGKYNHSGLTDLSSGTGYEITQNFDRDSSDYYKTAANASSLKNIFKVIATTVPEPDNADLNKDTVITDTLSDYFTFALTEDGKVDVKVYAEKGNEKTDITDKVTVNPNPQTKTVTVTDYDFSKHHTESDDPETLVIKIKVKPDTSYTNWGKSGKYETNKGNATVTHPNIEEPIAKAASPEVYVATYQVTYGFDTTAPDGATHPEDNRYYISGQTADVKQPEPSSIELDGHTYTFEGWKNGEANVGEKIDISGNVTLTGSWSKTPNTASYTVNYLWNGKAIQLPTTDEANYNDVITIINPAIDGYTLIPGQTTSMTIGTGENVLNLKYRKNVTLTANSDTKTYDGTEHTVTGYTAKDNKDNLVEGLTFTGVDSPSVSATDAGKYDVEFSGSAVGAHNELYIVTAANSGTLTINKRSVTLTSESASKVYDGTPLTKPNVTVGGDGFVEGEVTDIRATGSVTYVSEGEVTNTIKYTPTNKFKADNYNITKTEGKLTITEVSAPTPATFDFNDVVYGDGKVTPAITKTVKGNVGKNFTETFYVTVKGTDSESKATMSATLYTGKAEVIASKSLKDVPFLFKPEAMANAVVPYGKLRFTEAGTYTYTVREIPGQTSRMSYDTTEYTLTIEVVLDENANTYQVESWQFTAGNWESPAALNIVNTYRTYHPSTPSKPTLNTGDHYAYVMGYPDGTVRPNGSITRAEVSTILFRLLSDKTRDEYFTTESSFTDVKAGAWYNNSIATLEKAGVIVDTAKGGAFRPNEAITRAELAAMLAQFSDAKPVKGVKFSDVSAEHWAYEAIAIAAKMGWIEGYPDGTFRPDATITRAEMMTLVNRALDRVPSDEDHLLSKRVMLTFPDCKSGDWFYIAVQEATNSHTYERAATEKNGDEQWTALRANRDWTQLEK